LGFFFFAVDVKERKTDCICIYLKLTA